MPGWLTNLMTVRYSKPFSTSQNHVSDLKYLRAPWPSKLRFDKSGQHMVVAPAPAPVAEQTIQQLTWDGEPATVQELLNCYNLECKCLARWGGTTLFLVDAKSRAGKTEQVCEGQTFKLFLETCFPRQLVQLLIQLLIQLFTGENKDVSTKISVKHSTSTYLQLMFNLSSPYQTAWLREPMSTLKSQRTNSSLVTVVPDSLLMPNLRISNARTRQARLVIVSYRFKSVDKNSWVAYSSNKVLPIQQKIIESYWQLWCETIRNIDSHGD